MFLENLLCKEERLGKMIKGVKIFSKPLEYEKGHESDPE